MKNLLILSFILLNFLGWSQNSPSKRVKYEAATIAVMVSNDKGKVMGKNPIGNNVRIEYVIPSKVLFITYNDSNGKTIRTRFEYKNRNGEIITAEDSGGNIVTIIDDLELKGSILISPRETNDGKLFSMLIQSATKTY